MIAEPDGTFIENERFKFESNMIISDIDIQRIMSEYEEKKNEKCFSISYDRYFKYEINC